MGGRGSIPTVPRGARLMLWHHIVRMACNRAKQLRDKRIFVECCFKAWIRGMAEGFGRKDHSLDDAGGWITHTDNTSAGARPYTHGWILHIWVWDVKKKKPEGRVWVSIGWMDGVPRVLEAMHWNGLLLPSLNQRQRCQVYKRQRCKEFMRFSAYIVLLLKKKSEMSLLVMGT